MRGVAWLVYLSAIAAWPVEPQEAPALARGASGILTPGKGWELLGEGYQLTADPAVDRLGNVYFTDARKNRILKIDLEGRISTWKEGSNGAHGIACGRDGRLYAGQHERKRIVALGSDGAESVIAEGIQAHHLTVTSRNDIYLTEAPTHRVWLVDAAGRQRVVHEGLKWPRGVRTSIDQTQLLVGDPPANEIWRFQIQKDGSLADGRAVYRVKTMDGSAEADSGGMAFDAEGFLYVATKFGVEVFDREARLRALVEAPGKAGVNNVLFAGRGLEWLYVTDGDRVYRRPVRRRGARR